MRITSISANTDDYLWPKFHQKLLIYLCYIGKTAQKYRLRWGLNRVWTFIFQTNQLWPLHSKVSSCSRLFCSFHPDSMCLLEENPVELQDERASRSQLLITSFSEGLIWNPVFMQVFHRTIVLHCFNDFVGSLSKI